MARFITIGYGDTSGYDRAKAELKDAAHAHDAWLVERGAIVGMAGTPTQVRNHENSGIRTEQGSYLRSNLPIAGFALIEANSVEEAIALVSETPCAIAYGVVEVWPLVVPAEG